MGDRAWAMEDGAWSMDGEGLWLVRRQVAKEREGGEGKIGGCRSRKVKTTSRWAWSVIVADRIHMLALCSVQGSIDPTHPLRS